MSLNSVTGEKLKSYTLKGLTHIGLLTFTHSEIQKIEKYAFFGVENVTTISFHSSKVRDIMPMAFVGIGRVGSIKLKSTQVSTITCDTLEGLNCVGNIDWEGSPLRCDCNMQWMVETAANVSRDLTRNMKCASPHRVRSKTILDLKRDELNCNDEER